MREIEVEILKPVLEYGKAKKVGDKFMLPVNIAMPFIAIGALKQVETKVKSDDKQINFSKKDSDSAGNNSADGEKIRS